MKNKWLVFLMIGLVFFLGFFLLRSRNTRTPELSTRFLLNEDIVVYFSEAIEQPVIDGVGQPVEGFTPAMLTSYYSGLRLADFHQVEAVQGGYVYQDGSLEFVFNSDNPPHSSADAITGEGMRTLLFNIGNRFDIVVDSKSEVDQIIDYIR